MMRTFEKDAYAMGTLMCNAEEIVGFCYSPENLTRKEILDLAEGIAEAALHISKLSDDDFAALEPMV